MKKGYLIFNPSAGMKAKSPVLVGNVLRQFKAFDIEMNPSPTEPGGSVIAQTKELLKAEPDLLVVWGGDGTIHEVANGMFGSSVPLGILPGGTANLMVRELGIPSSVENAIQIVGSGKQRLISVGQANGRYFLLMVGIGFDSEVIRNVKWDLKKKLGIIAFGISAVQTAQSYSFPIFQMKADDKQVEGVFAVICNARHYAAFFVLTPHADISDEFLYVCLFKKPGVGNMFRYALHALNGKHEELESVEVIRARHVEVHSNQPVAVQADGELIGELPMAFNVHPQSLNVFCP